MAGGGREQFVNKQNSLKMKAWKCFLCCFRSQWSEMICMSPCFRKRCLCVWRRRSCSLLCLVVDYVHFVDSTISSTCCSWIHKHLRHRKANIPVKWRRCILTYSKVQVNTYYASYLLFIFSGYNILKRHTSHLWKGRNQGSERMCHMLNRLFIPLRHLCNFWIYK